MLAAGLSVLLTATAACGGPSTRAAAHAAPAALPSRPQPASSAPGQRPPLWRGIVAADNTFGLRLFQRLATTQPGGNVAISPLSVAVAMDMLYSGAAGATLSAMATTLDLGRLSPAGVSGGNAALLATLRSPQATGTHLSIADALWTRRGVPPRPAFVANARRAFAAQVATLDFAGPTAVRTVNHWVAQATDGHIPSVVQHLSPRTILFLASAFAFHGHWARPFNSAQTRPRPFFLNTGHSIAVPMMHRAGRYGYLSTLEAQVVRLPYAGRRYAMYVLLPGKGRTLNGLLRDFSPAVMKGWEQGMRRRYGVVDLPRFTIKATNGLVSPLVALGLRALFAPGANLSRLCPNGLSCYVNAASQDDFLAVDEAGTRAAAATTVGIVGDSVISVAPRPLFTFNANRPFLVALVDDSTGAVLMIAAVRRPR